MPAPRSVQFDIGHPAPDRGRVGLRWIVFGLIGGPLAWSLQIAAGTALGGLACLLPTGAARSGSAAAGTGAALLAVNVAALLLVLAALAVSLRSLRRTHHEERHRSGGVMNAGEGRTRFLAVWGVWLGLMFLVAVVASGAGAVWGSPCGG